MGVTLTKCQSFPPFTSLSQNEEEHVNKNIKHAGLTAGAEAPSNRSFYFIRIRPDTNYTYLGGLCYFLGSYSY